MSNNQNVPIIFSAIDATGAAFASVRGRLQGLGADLVSVRGIIGTLTAAFGAHAFAEGIHSASEAADAAAKMSDRFGVATESIVGTKHAVELAGGSVQGLTTAYRAQADLALKAASGNEEAKRTLQLLGLDAERFIKLPMQQQLVAITDSLHGMTNATMRNALARQSWGKSAGEMMGLVADGSEAIRKATADAEAWGTAINRVDAAKLEMANDAMKRAAEATRGVFTNIAIQLSPAVKALADHFADSKAEARGFRDEASRGAEIVAEAIGYVANVVQGMRFAWAAVKYGAAEAVDAIVAGVAWVADSITGAAQIIAHAVGAVANVVYGVRFAFYAAQAAAAEAFAGIVSGLSGMSNGFVTAAQVVAQGVGAAANVVQGLRFAWAAVTAAVAEFADFALRALASVVAAVAESKIADWAANLPGPLGAAARAVRASAEGARDSLALMAESTRASADSAKEALDGIANAVMPKDRIVAAVNDMANGARDALTLMAESTRASADRIKENLDRIASEGLPKDGIVAAVRAIRGEVNEFFSGLKLSTSDTATAMRDAVDAIALEGLPYDQIMERIKKVRDMMDAEAAALAKKRAEFNQDTGGELPKLQDNTKWMQDLAQRVERVQIENATELEMVQAHLVEKQNVLDLAAAQGLISDEVWQAQSAMVFAAAEAAKTKIIDDETKKRFGIANVYRQLDMNSAGFFLNQMAGLMQSKNRAMFEVGKAAAIGETIVQTYRAAQGAYAALAPIAFVGPALGAAAAAAAIVTGMARVQAIRSQQFGGGSGATPTYDASPNTGLPTSFGNNEPPEPPKAPAAAVTQAAQVLQLNLNVSFQGSGRYTQDEIMQSLGPALNDAIADGFIMKPNVGTT